MRNSQRVIFPSWMRSDSSLVRLRNTEKLPSAGSSQAIPCWAEPHPLLECKLGLPHWPQLYVPLPLPIDSASWLEDQLQFSDVAVLLT